MYLYYKYTNNRKSVDLFRDLWYNVKNISLISMGEYILFNPNEMIRLFIGLKSFMKIYGEHSV